MDSPYIENLKLLRQLAPVGMRHGLALLKQAEGDVERAMAMFRQETIALVMNKAGVTEQVAAVHLQQTAFDIALALRGIEETQYSLTERILKRYKNKREAISQVAHAVLENRRISRNYWLSFEELQHLPSALGCVLMLNEWLHYADWEGMDCAVYFHLEEILSQLDEQLQLPQLSDALRQLRRIEIAQATRREAELRTNGRFQPEVAFEAAVQAVEESEILLVEALYTFIQKHIQLFP